MGPWISSCPAHPTFLSPCSPCGPMDRIRAGSSGCLGGWGEQVNGRGPVAHIHWPCISGRWLGLVHTARSVPRPRAGEESWPGRKGASSTMAPTESTIFSAKCLPGLLRCCAPCKLHGPACTLEKQWCQQQGNRRSSLKPPTPHEPVCTRRKPGV